MLNTFEKDKENIIYIGKIVIGARPLGCLDYLALLAVIKVATSFMQSLHI